EKAGMETRKRRTERADTPSRNGRESAEAAGISHARRESNRHGCWRLAGPGKVSGIGMGSRLHSSPSLRIAIFSWFGKCFFQLRLGGVMFAGAALVPPRRKKEDETCLKPLQTALHVVLVEELLPCHELLYAPASRRLRTCSNSSVASIRRGSAP